MYSVDKRRDGFTPFAAPTGCSLSSWPTAPIEDGRSDLMPCPGCLSSHSSKREPVEGEALVRLRPAVLPTGLRSGPPCLGFVGGGIAEVGKRGLVLALANCPSMTLPGGVGRVRGRVSTNGDDVDLMWLTGVHEPGTGLSAELAYPIGELAAARRQSSVDFTSSTLSPEPAPTAPLPRASRSPSTLGALSRPLAAVWNE